MGADGRRLDWERRYSLRYDAALLAASSSGLRVSVSGGVMRCKPVNDFRRSRGPGVRGEIREFSRKSRRRLQMQANRLRWEPAMMTLLSFSDDFPRDGHVVQRLVNAWLTAARREGCGHYVRFLEWQRRGAPHIHVVFEHDLGVASRRKLAAVWARLLVKHLGIGVAQAARVRRFHANVMNWQGPRSSPDGLVRYALKYASKSCYQKVVPDGYVNPGRWWQTSRGGFVPWLSLEIGRDDLEGCFEAMVDGDEGLSKSPYLNTLRYVGKTAFLVLASRRVIQMVRYYIMAKGRLWSGEV